ncbi:hypothetical protein BGX34_010302 [Mortierella sp. NVP85]|nr:hypothetical protein BGX34_010302 [Mortierella sp. NVP85]
MAETGAQVHVFRRPASAFDATLDLLAREHQDIVVNAYANVLTSSEFKTVIASHLKVTTSGAFNVDFGFGTKVSTALRRSIEEQVNVEVEAGFTSNLRSNLEAIITEHCPSRDASCIHLRAEDIVKSTTEQTARASFVISESLEAHLAETIRHAVDVQVEKLSINLGFVRIVVTGDADVSHSVIVRFQVAASASANECESVSKKEVEEIRAICSRLM